MSVAPIPARQIVVAVDGPSGSGKSSVSRGVADRLGLRYLDTGAMYRTVAWQVLNDGIEPTDIAGVASLVADLDLGVATDPQAPEFSSSGVDVTEAIRGPDVAAIVSAVSSNPAVRNRLVQIQRALVREACSDGGEGIVVEGRDIGTVVLPDAKLKVFLTADVAARAQRRNLEDRVAGRTDGGSTMTLNALAARDQADSTRAASPLKRAADAVVIDATELSLEEVIAIVVELVRSRFDLSESAT